MAWATVRLNAGLNVEMTPTLNQTGYTKSQLIRFKNGLAQKLGGWSKFYPVLVDGVPKAIHTWKDLSNTQRFAMGTTTDVDLITNGIYKNIAPQRLTTTPAINFATTLGSPVVTIVDTIVNGVTTYDSVFLNVPISVGGIILSGLYAVTQNISATSYQITAATNATATVAAPGGSTVSFSTTINSALVTVNLAGHGLVAGSDIVFANSTTINGVTISGRYLVQSITDANNFIILCSQLATATTIAPVSINTTPIFTYHLTLGPQVAPAGYGTGTYGTGPYGLGTPTVGQSGTWAGATDWTLDNWGEMLVACPDGGAIHTWGPSTGYVNLQTIPQAPVFNTGAFVSSNLQFIIAYGSSINASIGVYQDPLMVRWCDQGNFNNWTTLYTNQAGYYRLSSGSAIIGGASTQQRNIIWTDKDLWISSYIGSTLVFNMVKSGEGMGLIAKHAHAEITDTVYWMGMNNFFVYDSTGPRILTCPVWDAVFQDLDRTKINLCFCGVNKSFSEIFFFFPSISGGLGQPDTYVKYNFEEKVWDYGRLTRSAWRDSDTFSYPISASYDGYIYFHENSKDADGAAMNYYYETGYFYISEGQEKVFIDRVYPDFKWGTYNGSQNALILITLFAIQEMGGAVAMYGPYAVDASTPWIEPRIRARQVSMRIEGNDVASFTRLGAVRFRYAPDGRAGGI